ncbi:MBL fold metallo-hydrolase [Nocardia amikacinitolerans]|uniref:MBL fold metallo-hydrolase n=1 Tax=Nocardia amikacinitolerans TaxID=756689 RepID=UPI0020A402D7|nr:MBL fold metallo-hydrolase [Nocardia amikacinitolerans]MCP2279404.1 cyclase [Nocardia amikacinitolerans]
MTATETSAAPTVTEIADGVYAYTHSRGGWCVSNAGVLAGPDGAVVIDTLATEGRTRALVEFVDGLGAGPARTIVNTHHHGDHNFGNHLFGPAAVVVGHDRIRPEMTDTGLALTKLWPNVDWGDVRVTLPGITFSDNVTLHVGERRVELIHLGPAAHTTNDVVAWLPAERVLFAGDLVMSGAAPFCLMGSVSGSIAAVRRLFALGAETVVAGHGPVTGPEIFDQTLRYLRWVQDLAAEGRALGLTPLAIALEADHGEFGGLVDQERLVGNLYRADAELSGGPLGEPLDVLSIFDEMVLYNGGQVPACLA